MAWVAMPRWLQSVPLWLAGGFFGMKYLEEGSLSGAFQAFLARG